MAPVGAGSESATGNGPRMEGEHVHSNLLLDRERPLIPVARPRKTQEPMLDWKWSLKQHHKEEIQLYEAQLS